MTAEVVSRSPTVTITAGDQAQAIITVAVCDDQEIYREGLCAVLGGEPDLRVTADTADLATLHAGWTVHGSSSSVSSWCGRPARTR